MTDDSKPGFTYYLKDSERLAKDARLFSNCISQVLFHTHKQLRIEFINSLTDIKSLEGLRFNVSYL